MEAVFRGGGRIFIAEVRDKELVRGTKVKVGD